MIEYLSKKTEQVLCVKYQGMGVEPLGEKLEKACDTILHPLLHNVRIPFSLCNRYDASPNIKRKGLFFMKKNYLIVTYKLVLTAMFVGLSVVASMLSRIDLLAFGVQGGVRISLGPVFTAVPAVLFGPFFGGLASGLSDIVGFILKPVGAYNPLITLSAFLGGALRGLFWSFIRKKSVKNLNIAYLLTMIIFLAMGVTNHVMMVFQPDSSWVAMLEAFGKNKDIIIYMIDFIAVAGLVFYIINYIIVALSKEKRIQQYLLKLMLALGIAGLIQTSINTVIIKFMYNMSMKGFYPFWAARLAEEVFITVVKAFFISIILMVYEKNTDLNKKLG